MSLIKLKVNTNSQQYSIIIGNNILKKVNKFLKENSIDFNQCLLVIDKNIPKNLVKDTLKSLPKGSVSIHYFNASEKNKNLKSVNEITSILLKKSFNRNDCLISIGGGITGDVSGFAASTFKRGLKFVNIPTTLLSQVDSSIGGKTGVNTKYGKNLIGSFYQPSLVISDTNFLNSLPKREVVCGYGEILKHSLINGKKFFYFLNKNGKKIIQLKSPFIQTAIHQSCLIKKKVVEADEKELGIRKILNFGHTFAHAFEATLCYSAKLNHGEAVILGVKTAARFSLLNKILNKKEFELIDGHLNDLNLPRDINKFFSIKNLNTILSFMKKDKKNQIGILTQNMIYFLNPQSRSVTKEIDCDSSFQLLTDNSSLFFAGIINNSLQIINSNAQSKISKIKSNSSIIGHYFENNNLVLLIKNTNEIRAIDNNGIVKWKKIMNLSDISSCSVKSGKNGIILIGILDAIENKLYLLNTSGQFIANQDLKGSEKIQITQFGENAFSISTVLGNAVIQYTKR